MAENGLSLQQRLADTVFASIEDLQEIAEEMFTRFYTASGTAAQERAKMHVLMQEIQRLEEENGSLRTELVDTEERYWTAHEEVDKLKKELDWTLGQLSNAVKERTELSNEKTKLETQIRQMVAKAAKKGDPSGVREDATSPCAGEALGAAPCPKCGSMDVRMDAFGTGLHRCEVCGKTFGVHQDG